MIRILKIFVVAPLLSALACSDRGGHEKEVCLAAVGDVMLGRYIGKVT